MGTRKGKKEDGGEASTNQARTDPMGHDQDKVETVVVEYRSRGDTPGGGSGRRAELRRLNTLMQVVGEDSGVGIHGTSRVSMLPVYTREEVVRNVEELGREVLEVGEIDVDGKKRSLLAHLKRITQMLAHHNYTQTPTPPQQEAEWEKERRDKVQKEIPSFAAALVNATQHIQNLHESLDAFLVGKISIPELVPGEKGPGRFGRLRDELKHHQQRSRLILEVLQSFRPETMQDRNQNTDEECIIPALDVHKKKPVEVGIRKVRKKDSSTKPPPVKISLNDCLACTGCVTSAESVLIDQQSHKELQNLLISNSLDEVTELTKKKIVITVSPQTLSSLAVLKNLSIQTIATKLQSYFYSRGVSLTIDSTFARNFSLLASQKEFLDRYASRTGKQRIPLLSSVCPGWICYAEKSHGKLLLPNVSRVRSPQAIMGGLVKDFVSKHLGCSAADIYHVSIMPCFDKKLEASRPDFGLGEEVREVDCVISTGELELLLQENEIDLEEVSEVCPSISSNKWLDYLSSTMRDLESHSGSGSGGYTEQVFRNAASTLFGVEVEDLEYHVQRNKDFHEVKLEREGAVLLRMGVMNGFRNIQTLVQKMKRAKMDYDYIEIMACPSGCLNGGGQIPSHSMAEREETLNKVKEVYATVKKTPPGQSVHFQELLKEWLGSLESDKAKTMLWTDFHDREANNPQNSVVVW